MTTEEYIAVQTFLETNSELNLTAISDTTPLNANYIYFIEWAYPPKQQVLNYLDENGPIPERWARAEIYRGTVPDVVEYLVSRAIK